jgi:hypothetical protein
MMLCEFLGAGGLDNRQIGYSLPERRKSSGPAGGRQASGREFKGYLRKVGVLPYKQPNDQHPVAALRNSVVMRLNMHLLARMELREVLKDVLAGTAIGSSE